MRTPTALGVLLLVCGGSTPLPSAAAPSSGEAAFWTAAEPVRIVHRIVPAGTTGAEASRAMDRMPWRESTAPGLTTPAAAGQALAPGDQAASAPAPAPPSRAADVLKFLAGGAFGLCAHEAGHLAFDYTFDAGPGVRRVSFGPLPFFAITHDPLSPRREFTVSSAGFWVQELGNEILLTARPQLRGEHAPMAKGLLAFNVLTSMAYAGAAIAHAGPPERDTRSMAIFLGVDESAVGAMLLAPAVLDAVRYYRPAARWAMWASRGAKVATVLLVMRKGRTQD